VKLKLYLRVMRLDHWFKNVFVLVGSIAAIYYLRIEITFDIILYILGGLLLACLTSSANYIVNEVLDAPFDKNHPTKRNRPIPKGLIKPPALIFLFFIIVGFVLAVSLMVRWQLFIALVMLLVAGLIYNLRPIRAKDIPYLDVISESVNNPIRIFIGWFTVYRGEKWPPWELLILLWCFGAFLMTGKRLAEYRFLGNTSSQYRSVFKYYSHPILLIIMIIYALASVLLYIQLAIRFQKELLYSIPLVLIFLIWFLKLCFEPDSIAKEPERIYKRPFFFLYTLASFLVIIYVAFI
jgi:decaprenyl-phosphate phosphoribosyltransferase